MKVSKKPQVRTLKIHKKFRATRYETKLVPEIKLCGKWLERLGFEKGKTVQVTEMDNLIILRIEN
jgi:toxic protein SymE